MINYSKRALLIEVVIGTLIALFFLALAFDAKAVNCKKAKKYGKYDTCYLECGFKHGSTLKKFTCEKECKKKYKKVLKFRKKYEACYPLSREDALTALRGKYNINPWLEQ